EIPELLAGLTAEAIPKITAIGPGKSAQFGTRSKAGAGQKRGSERKIAFGEARGSMPSIERVHIASLTVDSSYQRSIDNDGSRRLIASIAANFDWRLCAPLVVSRRIDGSKVIIDGQHRWAAAIRRGDLPQLPCCLFTYDSPEDEARMFIVANRARKAMNRMDDFHAALAAGDEDALDIRRLVSEAGLTIARSTSSTAWKPGEVTFTSSIATALRRHGDAVVS
ncbi:ParB N-terminal domain-containing protein, partial [Elstera litoralis]